jgi:predicted TIM-barrel fold metal-dependent hydrolase
MEMNDMILVSVDDHVVEPPNMFENHLSSTYNGIRPRLVRLPDGRDQWQFGDDVTVGNIGLNAVVGRVKEEYGCEPVSYDEMRRGVWDLDARIDDMNINGIAACVNFPTIAGLDGGLFHKIKDRAQALTLLRAYNDWHLDELCAGYPGRNIPNIILPYWDVNLCVEEIRRNVAKGCHAVVFSDNPTVRGMPSIHNAYWEPLWKVCAENEVVINLHIGSGIPAPHASMESPIEAWITTMPISIANAAADWLNLQALHRYPDLKIALSEGSIGWIPYFLERADFTNEHHGPWTHSKFGGGKPSDMFRKHFVTCFLEDRFGLHNLDWIGEDNVMYECDYPHSDTRWPEVPEYLWDTVKHLPERQINKVTHENALRLFKFDLFGKMGGRENCTVGALRAQAGMVSTEPLALGGVRPDQGEEGPVTSGEVLKLFSDSLA